MIGYIPTICSCGNQFIFRSTSGTFYCEACGRMFCIDDLEPDELNEDYPPENI